MATTPVAARLLADESQSASLAQRLLVLLISRRVAISMVLFTGLVLMNLLVLGTRPRSIFNFADPVAWAGVLLVLAGLTIRSWAAGTLRKYKQLITTGPYALVRNPLYVGSFLMMAGYCTLLGDGWSYLVVFVPMVVLYTLAVRDEEQLLAHLFPDQWPVYANSTPRFLPRRLATTSEGWSLAQWRRNAEYNAWLGGLAALAGLQVWFATTAR